MAVTDLRLPRINRTLLAGRVVRDFVLRYTTDEVPVAEILQEKHVLRLEKIKATGGAYREIRRGGKREGEKEIGIEFDPMVATPHCGDGGPAFGVFKGHVLNTRPLDLGLFD